MSDPQNDLVDRIYEAAVLPELWPEVLVRLADYGGADAAVLFTSDLDSSRFVTTPNFAEPMRAYIEEGWFTRTDRTKRLLAKRHAGFVTDLDVYTPEEFKQEPVFREFFNPRGFGMGAASVINVPTGDQLVFDVERALERGPISTEAVVRLDGMRPHLARAATMSARLRLQTVRAAAQALETVGLPAAVLGHGGRTLAMNPRCERLLNQLIVDGRRLVLMDPAADRLLARALDELSAEAQTSTRSIPLAARNGQPPTILHLLPIRRAAADLFAAAEAIAVFTPLTAKHVPGLSVLEGLFDLTAAEARVARGIAGGSTVASLSAEFGTSSATVRSQLKAVMSKTGTARQAELVQLLAGAALPVS
jgi:DNA-binding CsgD family transcriptional regulator